LAKLGRANAFQLVRFQSMEFFGLALTGSLDGRLAASGKL
jgi:hypothetical protein